ncbi:hypothetical protein KDK95_13885 [Actinospica sp. MGRD01-02]|uniref:Integral membrane protein n=1 Tax=Actinospica acidithermotolerans TaxID=2828514 RepID=A0A941EGV3_9ACTN|nr:hypothetical protein [Actinospica acidithermotolerans]MBR7827404.1 hypothetical protein [Actinospica acidithermotolerans]
MPASNGPSGTRIQAAAPAARAPGSTAAAAKSTAPREFRQRPIPLRPLSVLELIDGAVGAIPSVPKAILARAAAVVTLSSAAALALTWWFNRMISQDVQAHPSWTSTDFFGDATVNYAPSTGEKICLVTTEILIAVVCSGFAATVLAGLFAPSVKGYVDAEPVDAAKARAMLRRRTARLYVLAAITTVPRAFATFLFGLAAHAAAVNPAGKVSGWYFLICLGFVPLCFVLKSVTAVAAPAAVLEGAGIGTALRRSRRLAARGIFRIGWCSLLTMLIAACATASLTVFGWQLRDAYGVGDQFAGLPGSPGFSWWLVAYAVTYLVTLLLTTPYRAATATLLYVDRRFRREGLDIRIAWARLANRSRRTQGSML